QESLLGAAALDAAGDVEERRRLEDAALHQPDAPGLLDDEEPVRIEARGGHVHRMREPGRDQLGGDRRAADRRDAGADRGRVLQLTGRRAAVTAGGVAVVAFLPR